MNSPFRASLAALLVAATWSPASHAQTGACVDTDGDGYGWNGVSTCDPNASSPDTAAAVGACIDSDGDGYGWNGVATCLVNTDTSSAADTACIDSDGDGYGWNAATQSTCLIGSNLSGSGSADMGLGNLSGSGSADLGAGNLSGSGSADLGAGSNDASNDADTSADNNDNTNTNDSADNGGSTGDLNTSNPGGTTYTSTYLPIGNVAADQCLTRQDTINSNYPGAIIAGDFILSINAWNFSAAGNYDWEQCIFANNGGLGWTYDWGAGGGSGDFFVRSYPELIYGVKSGGEISGSSAREGTGLPERVDRLPFISIDYDFSSVENGPARPVDASLNPRFPNGTIINGERNIAIESFFHPSDANGNCPASVVQRGGGQSNHTYEIMVWIDSGAERLPAGPNDYVTTVNLDGATYDVYTKDNDRKYVAFVRTSPSLSGTLNWTTFINWTSENAHQVTELYGANTNSVQLQDTWCLANILVGNEIWWGRGEFTINQWQINRTY